ncbi:MAG: TIGR02757 family protein [Alphaproteobacteria bacterium]|nr:MAG: TIGR02757 family protein [Alphaproteobacteria bacterium]
MHGLYELLEKKYDQYNRTEFIESDPVSIPHMFSKKENIELAGFLTATIAWGQRNTIIRNARRLMELMGNDPVSFISDASDTEIERLEFCHRTFSSVDLHCFIYALKNIYLNHGGLETLFTKLYVESRSMKNAFIAFREVFFELKHSTRTGKHVANVSKNASAKRLNLFLRWMVRNDDRGVDFGIWQKIPSSALYIPLDIHSGNVARKLELLTRKQNDWNAVEILTDRLRRFDPEDPVKYDFALFGMGVFEN